jgi:hypothetical protein
MVSRTWVSAESGRGIRLEHEPPATVAQREGDYDRRFDLHRGVVFGRYQRREVSVDHAPRRRVFVPVEFVADRRAHCAVQAIGADQPTRIAHALAVGQGTQARPDNLLRRLEPGELDAALDLATKPLELVGEDALGFLLGNAEVEGKRTVETVEPDGCDLRAAREKVDRANDAPAPQ